MIRNAVEHWWLRALLPCVLVAVLLLSNALLGFEGSPILFIMFAMLLLQLVGTELVRSRGSFLSTGLWITPSFPRMVLIGLAGGTGCVLLVAGIAIALGAVFRWDGMGISISSVLILVVASLLEELFFRGTMFEALRERFGNYVAVGATSVLFGLAHTFNHGATVLAIVNVVLAGVLFGALTVYSGSLWPAMIFHALWNVLVRTFFGTVSGNAVNGWLATLDVTNVAPGVQWILTGPFGIEQGACTTLTLCTAIMATVALVKPDGTVRAARYRRDQPEGHHER